MSQSKRRKARRNRAQSLVELLVGLAALIPIMLVVFDLAVILIAVQMNDSTCREAARVAAAGSPSDIQTRAGAIITRANLKAKGMMQNIQMISCTSTTPTNYLQNISQFGGPVYGTVTVQTEVDVYPFVVQWAYAGKSPLKFRSQQSFPFTYVVPNTTGTTSP